MTKQEAIERLHNLQSLEEDNITACVGVWYEGIKDDYDHALDMAIKALKVRTDGDTISRQDAIDAFEEHLDYLQMLNKDENPTAESKWYGVNWARNTIADLPSAQPERKKGEWIDDGFKEEWWGEQFTCSICGGTMIGVTNYCADCGADMREVTK